MKHLLLLLLIVFLSGCNPSVQNTPQGGTSDAVSEQGNDAVVYDSVLDKSFSGRAGEKYLRLEINLEKSIEEVWALFTTEGQIVKWMAPKVKLDLRVGGSITTYTPGFPDVVLGIPTLIPNELLVYKVNLNTAFNEQIRKEGINLQEIIHLKEIGKGRTRVTATMVGWGEGQTWDKIYNFFRDNNIESYKAFVTASKN